jgi:hypothetical protein
MDYITKRCRATTCHECTLLTEESSGTIRKLRRFLYLFYSILRCELTLQKGCFREQFLKTTSETALFCRILHELDDDYFQIKQNKERKKCIQNRLMVSCEQFK